MSSLIVNRQPDVALAVALDNGTREVLCETMIKQRNQYLERITQTKDKLSLQMDNAGNEYTYKLRRQLKKQSTLLMLF